jgi:hypothetical protein
MRFCLFALPFALLFITVVSAQQEKPFEPEYFSVFYYLPASGSPIELERQIPTNTLKGSKLLLSIPGEKSPARVIAGSPIQFVVRVTEAFDKAVATLQLFRFEIQNGTRVISTRKPTNKSRNIVTGLKLSAEPYGSSSLKVTPAQPLSPGEYCISRNTIPQGFCFGVDPAPTP